jgi:hypothetical protein
MGNGVSPGWRRKASSAAAPEGPLRATLFGSCAGAGPTVGRREGQGRRRQGRVEFFRTELFEQQQLLGERQRAEQRAGFAVGGVVETEVCKLGGSTFSPTPR